MWLHGESLDSGGSRWIVAVDDLVKTQDGINAPPPFFNRRDVYSRIPFDVDGDWVYFGWSGDEVVYVGMTSRLRTRIGSGQHQSLTDDMMVSYVSCKDRREAFYMECYFVWRYKPTLNKIPHENRVRKDEIAIANRVELKLTEPLFSIEEISSRWKCGRSIVCRTLREESVPVTYVGKRLRISLKNLLECEDRMFVKTRQEIKQISSLNSGGSSSGSWYAMEKRLALANCVFEKATGEKL